jgi:hypothetical protein
LSLKHFDVEMLLQVSLECGFMSTRKPAPVALVDARWFNFGILV